MSTMQPHHNPLFPQTLSSYDIITFRYQGGLNGEQESGEKGILWYILRDDWHIDDSDVFPDLSQLIPDIGTCTIQRNPPFHDPSYGVGDGRCDAGIHA